MRVNRMSATFRMPVSFYMEDGNGIVYTEEAVRKAMNHADGSPFIYRDNDGRETVIGVVDHATFRGDAIGGYIETDVSLCGGGTVDDVTFKKKESKRVVDTMEVIKFGICK